LVFDEVDWSEKHHDVCIVDEHGNVLSREGMCDGIEGIARLHALVAKHADEPPRRSSASRSIGGWSFSVRRNEARSNERTNWIEMGSFGSFRLGTRSRPRRGLLKRGPGTDSGLHRKSSPSPLSSFEPRSRPPGDRQSNG
jgi:hypothetical protein